MRQKIANGIVTVFEVGCVIGLIASAVDAELKRHKAEKAKEKAELECAIYKFCDYVNCIKIKNLEKELEELKAKEEA